MKKILYLGILAVLLVSCGPKIYTDASISYYTKNHQTLAILPPKVSIPAQKNVAAAAMVEEQKAESVNFQKEMYSWLLQRKQQGKLRIDIQDVDVSIAKLNKIGYYEGNTGASMTPDELAQALSVDAVLSSNYALSKPMSTGTAILVAAIFGVWGSTAKAVVDLNLYDGKTGKMIWNYNHQASGTFSSTNDLVNSLMNNASKKLPYIVK